jgi:hypothetical protein
MPYYARVTTKTGEVVHLAEVPTRNRPFSLDGLKTLCGYPVERSCEGTSDACDCLVCQKREKERPLERRSVEDPSLVYVPRHRR